MYPLLLFSFRCLLLSVIFEILQILLQFLGCCPLRQKLNESVGMTLCHLFFILQKDKPPCSSISHFCFALLKFRPHLNGALCNTLNYHHLAKKNASLVDEKGRSFADLRLNTNSAPVAIDDSSHQG